MIESEFAFFQMQVKGRFGDAVKFHQSSFRIGPEGFDAIYVTATLGKFILAMGYAIVLFKAKINQVHNIFVGFLGVVRCYRHSGAQPWLVGFGKGQAGGNPVVGAFAVRGSAMTIMGLLVAVDADKKLNLLLPTY